MAMICSVLAARAQFGDNKFFAGGALNGSYYRHSSDNVTSNYLSFGLSPQVARVLGGNSVLGLDLSGALSSSKSNENTVSNAHSLGSGLFYQRYYPLSDRLFFTTKLAAALATSKSSYRINGDEQSSGKDRIFSASLNPGLAWRASDRVLLNASIGVIGYSTNTYYHSSPAPTYESNSFQIGFRSPSFGVSFLFN